MKETAYSYKNLPIPGGGYVTGFLFHQNKEQILYIRTDIGGCYRFDYENRCWHSLSESVNMFDLSETYPIAIATDFEKAGMLYVASGIHESRDENGKPWGKLSISADYGETFIHKKLPFYVHGNMNGRGTGLRLVKSRAEENTLYFASQRDGLWRTEDEGGSWQHLETGGEDYMTFIWCSESGRTLIVGTAGVCTGDEKQRGHSLYVSYDSGRCFEKLPMPENVQIEDSRWSGYVAQRYDFDGRYFYVTLANTGKNSYVVETGYSCDSGDVTGGRILRYELDEKEHIIGYADITPSCGAGEEGVYALEKGAVLDYGFGGISSCKSMPGLLAASTLCRDEGDILYISYDYGKNWEVAMYDLSIGNLHFESTYMKPEYNGGHSLLHWLSDVKINPFCPDEVWFNSGTGVFVGRHFTRKDRSFCDCCRGIEETVHLNVYSMPAGPVKVLDIVGDLGGFAFTKLDEPCENSFADREGNRYITCINADFAEKAPGMVLATPRGNWKGKTKGGLILSEDHGLTFDRIPLPFGISAYLDERFQQIEQPNVNSGWAALSSDGKSIVYGVADGIELFAKGVVVSNDRGQSFQKVKIYALGGRDISDTDEPIKIFSDRVRENCFYGFGNGMKFFVSNDSGKSFYQMTEPVFEEALHFGLIDCADGTEIRGESGREGSFYAALGQKGLYKLTFLWQEENCRKVSVEPLVKEQEAVYCVGLGLSSPDADYFTSTKALYICGVIDGVYGFFRSFDEGKQWEKINNESQQFGDINSIAADARHFGRFYIATGSFGVKYGEPV